MRNKQKYAVLYQKGRHAEIDYFNLELTTKREILQKEDGPHLITEYSVNGQYGKYLRNQDWGVLLEWCETSTLAKLATKKWRLLYETMES